MVSKSRGFTLIEMLVAISIVGILSAMGMISFNGARAVTRDAKRTSDLAEIRLALALYYDDHDSYPAPATSGGAGPDTSVGVDNTIFSEIGNPMYPGYLNRIYSDPINNAVQGYYYHYDSNQNLNNRGYVLCFHKESENGRWFYFYSTGVYGEGDHCPVLP